MAQKYEDSWLQVIKRLNELSNISPEQERQDLLEAARQEPRILDDRDVTLADIARLAGIKEYTETPKVSKQAEQLIESITGEKSSITKMIEESDKQAPKKTVKEAKKPNRLETIADLEEKLAELKAEQKAEQTYESEAFREVLSKDIAEYIKTAEDKELVELYNSISNNEAIYNEESSNILIKTEETKEIIADAEKLEQEVIAEKEKAEEKEEVVQEEGEASGFTDKQIRMAFGVLNDPKYKGGNYDGAVEVINKIAPGLADHPSVANALKRANEDTNEAHGYEGQSEYRAHTIRLAGDFDQENPVSDADAEAVKQAIIKNSAEQEGRGIVMDVEPAEGAYDSVVVHTMRDREDVLKYLGDMVDESTETPYTDELSQ
jgi:phage gp16-like protein